jgi:hypothetical protein
VGIARIDFLQIFSPPFLQIRFYAALKMNFDIIEAGNTSEVLPPIEFNQDPQYLAEEEGELDDDEEEEKMIEFTDAYLVENIGMNIESIQMSELRLIKKLFEIAVQANSIRVDTLRISEIRNHVMNLGTVLDVPEADKLAQFRVANQSPILRKNHDLIRRTRLIYLRRFKNAFNAFLREIEKHFDVQLESVYEECLEDQKREYFQFEGKIGSNRCREFRKNLLSNIFNVVDMFGFDATYCVRSGPWSDSEITEIVIELSALLFFVKEISESGLKSKAKSAIFGAIYALAAYGMQDPFISKALIV